MVAANKKKYLSMSMFHNSKETITKIGYIRMIHPTKVYCHRCQTQLNKALDVVVEETNKADDKHFSNYGTT
eukprot:2203213-Ditylum_brightwellii.AAC.1